MIARTVLGVFARYWTPGAVKTRLAHTIGPHSAAEIYRFGLEVTLRRFAQVAEARRLVVTPAGQEAAFSAVAGCAWRVQPQVAGDLGTRISSYFADMFAGGAERVVLIGSDSPTLPTSFIEEAFDRLASAPVVLGPADDGGYYLVGLSAPVLDLFVGIDWGTPRVWEQSVARLEAAGHEYAILPSWYDVDDIRDLQRLRAELTQLAPPDPIYRALATGIEAALAHFP